MWILRVGLNERCFTLITTMSLYMNPKHVNNTFSFLSSNIYTSIESRIHKMHMHSKLNSGSKLSSWSHGHFTSKVLEIGWDLIWGALHFCKKLKKTQCNITSFLFTYGIISIIFHPIMSWLLFKNKTTYRVMCLGWYKTYIGSSGFSTHIIIFWALSNVLVVLSHDIVVLLRCLVVFL